MPILHQKRALWRQDYRGGGQEDAPQVLMELLNACNEVDVAAAAALGAPEALRVRYTSPLWQVFGTLQKSRSVCSLCGQVVLTHEMLQMFPLALPEQEEGRGGAGEEPGPITLEGMFTRYLAEHRLRRDDRCEDNCQALGARTRVFEIPAYPRLLAVQIMRW